jgi:hypothetical protein
VNLDPRGINRALSENDRPSRRRLYRSDTRRASRNGERPRRALQERLDLLLQRAPIQTGPLLQAIDSPLIKAPHEDRAYLILHTRSGTRWDHSGAAKVVAIRERIGDGLRGSERRRTLQSASGCVRMALLPFQSGP